MQAFKIHPKDYQTLVTIWSKLRPAEVPNNSEAKPKPGFIVHFGALWVSDDAEKLEEDN